jgi:hypothetical protein
MNKAQRATYFGRLWPAACEAQGWNPKDEERRRDVTFGVTGQESTSSLGEDQVTALFDELRWLADPFNLDAALPASDARVSRDNNRRRQLVWSIEQLKLTEAYVDSLAAPFTQQHRCQHWDELPLDVLTKFRMTCRARARSLQRDGRSPIKKLGRNTDRLKRLGLVAQTPGKSGG